MMPGKIVEAISTGEQQRNSNNLLVGDNTNSGFVGVPKKTRDLPNLSECHNCGYRINTTNGRDKLQTLRSEWRIVLLCRKCAKLVESGELCPYCFSVASNKENCFRCRDCSRRVHEHCVLKHKGFAPSAYYSCSPGSGFTVCLDCWLPEPLLKLRSRAGFKEGCRSGKVSKSGNGGQAVEKNCIKVLEDREKDANFVLEKKVVAAANARQLAATTVVLALKAVKVANTTLDLVSKRDDSSANCATNKAVDDAKLAFQLHRALNSSRRISKNLCSVNSSYLAVPATMCCNAKSSVTAVSRFKGDRENGKCNGGNCNVEEKSYSDRLINSSDDDKSLETESQSCGRGIGNGNPHSIRSCSPSNCDTETDRYYFKYSKMKSSSKPTPQYTQSCGNEMHLNYIQSHWKSDCDTKTDHYCLKYSRRNSSLKETHRCRPKFLYEGSELESRVSDCGSLQNCSKKCKTFSDAAPLQAYACLSGSSGDQY